jgi:hypothetical protein
MHPIQIPPVVLKYVPYYMKGKCEFFLSFFFSIYVCPPDVFFFFGFVILMSISKLFCGIFLNLCLIYSHEFLAGIS